MVIHDLDGVYPYDLGNLHMEVPKKGLPSNLPFYPVVMPNIAIEHGPLIVDSPSKHM